MHDAIAAHDSCQGAALLTALGLLFIFSLMGVAYVDSVSITLDQTHYAQRLLRVRTVAAGGIEAGIGEMRQALTAGRTEELLKAPFEIQVPIYGPNRQDPNGFVPQANRRGAAKVTITEERGPLAELAAKGAKSPVHCFRILSESRISDLGPDEREVSSTHGRAEAVVVLGEDNTSRTIYWDEANR